MPPDAMLVEKVRAVLAARPFHTEGRRKVRTRLHVDGTCTWRRPVLRLMREKGMLVPTRTGSPQGPRSHDGTIVPETVDTMWTPT